MASILSIAIRQYESAAEPLARIKAEREKENAKTKPRRRKGGLRALLA